MATRYDVTIAYRISPGLGRKAFIRPSWTRPQSAKYDLSRICLKSLLGAFAGINYKLYAILDGCPSEYKEMFTELIDSRHLQLVELSGKGNAATFLEQIRLLENQHESDVVYFAEDDYLYTENAMFEMVEMIRDDDVDFVTPYDHIDYYQTKPDPTKPAYLVNLHNYRSKIRFKSRHWRTVSSTTMTFLTKKTVLRKAVKYLRLYPKLSDYGMWLALTKMRRTYFSLRGTVYLYEFAGRRLLIGKPFTLWSPMPSLATHMVEPFMAPGVDWNKLIRKYAMT
jgi:hypothetical protein